MIDIEKDAKELLASAKAKRANSVNKPEARDAGAESSPEKVKTKAEVIEKLEVKPEVKPEPKLEVETQAKKDEEILTKKEDDLTPEQKTRKTELVKIKQDAEEKEKKSNVQKRIDELTGKVKDLERDNTSTKAERDAIRNELDGLKKQLSMTPNDKIKEKVKSEMSSRVNKYIEADKGLPRENRREMTKEEIDEWALEDWEAANEWVSRRTIRRVEEERDFKLNLETSLKAEEILDKQEISSKRTYIKHPELDTSKRKEELRKEGKKTEEIHNILLEENEKYKMCFDVYNENPNKWIVLDNAPELIVEEMEKRLSKMPKKEDSEVEKLRAEVERLKAEKAQLEGLDSGISSTRHAPPKEDLTDFEKQQIKLAEEVGLNRDKIKARVSWRKDNVR